MTEGSELHPQAAKVRDRAAEAGVSITVREFEQTRTADDAARAVGCTVDQIVKSMIFDADGEVVLALTSGAHRVDGQKLAELAGVDRCGRADPEQVRAVTGFAIGGVPPFAHDNTIRTWIDPHLLGFDEVWGAGGTPRHVFAIRPDELLAVTGADPGDFTS